MPENYEMRLDLKFVHFSAPEVLQTGTASPMTDIWGVGLLGFLL